MKDSFRTRQLRTQLEAAQEKLRTEPYRKVELEVERLETLLAAAERDDAARTKRMAGLAEAEAAKTEARRQEEQAEIEAELRRRYDHSLPIPTTDKQWNDVREFVLHHHRLREMHKTDELVTATARRYRF